MATGKLNIRPYEPRDRAAVREICCDTADSGEPMESFFPHREVLADLVTRYYTDYEPHSVWVAERDGRVVGYLTGCLNTTRFRRVMAWRIAPVILCKALARGTPWHPQVRALLRANLGDWCRGGLRSGVSLAEYPAHLHVDLRAEARGCGVGRELMSRWFAQVRAAGVHGIHAGVNADNINGCRFFEAMGFTVLDRQSRLRLPDGRLIETLIYGCILT